MKKNKLLIVFLIIILVYLFYKFGLNQYLTLETLKSQRDNILIYYHSHTLLTILLFSLLYIISTAASLPGAIILTLSGGAIFGSVTGTMVVSICSTTGATLAFYTARYLFRDWIEVRYKKYLDQFDAGIKENALNYILFLRLVPIFPFFIINLVMGLTRIPANKYIAGSWLGMLPGTFVYVYAGSQLAHLNSIQDILSVKIIIAFILLGILALFPSFIKKFKKGAPDAI